MRKDLYSQNDLSPVAGESASWAEIEQRYLRGFGHWRVPDEPSAEPLSCMAGSIRPRKIDTDLFEILTECLAQNEIPFVHKYQKSGTCVGQASATCSDIALAVAWLLDYKFPGRSSVACHYAGGRVDVAGRPGTWQGSNGSWAIGWALKWGVATLKEIGLPETSTDEDERLGLRWTATRAGVPDKFELIAKNRPITGGPLVTTIEEAVLAIEAGAPIINCSNLIPSGNTDKNGVSRVRRAGGHATTFSAVRWVAGDPQFKYTNSWSANWGDNGHVWLVASDVQLILNQEDSYAWLGVNGLESLWSLKVS